MCGIVGIVSFSGAPVDEARLVRMRDVLRHRGPDDEGIWAQDAVGFGHRRLSIIDVQAGRQPMSNDQATVWLVFNGEIYNHAILRRRLEDHGHKYRTRSDTETIIHLYEDEGECAVEQLHGMFAFALWDRSRRHLLIARDRLGIKPLYYAITPRELVFASEVKAILASSAIQPRLTESVVPEFLATRYVFGEETFFEGIRKLLPGHLLTWSAAHGVQTRQYWALPNPPSVASTTFERAARDLEGRLSDAVSRHLMSDVPLGVFLSGGIDSSAIAATAARLTRDPIQTFSVGFAELDANELPFARSMAERIGSIHRDITVSADEFFDVLPRLVWHEDEPIAFSSSVPLYFVSVLAGRHVKVVLTGEGADELFLGYNRYRVTLWNTRLGRPYWTLVP